MRPEPPDAGRRRCPEVPVARSIGWSWKERTLTVIHPDQRQSVNGAGAAASRKRPGRRRDVSIRVALGVCICVVALGAVYPTAATLSQGLSREALPQYAEFMTTGVDLEILRNTLVLGFLVGTVGTAVGFLFAFVQTRLAVPGKRVLHVLALVPIVSPPFAVATAAVVLYGRRGIVTHGLLGWDYDLYGLDGLVLVLSLSFFPVGYLGLLGMMRALDPALEEAATNLGAGRWQAFRTVLLPLLAAGFAAPFLLLFVEAIADLANPLAIGGDYTVLASRAYLAITGEYDLTRASVYCVILLFPTVSLFLLQRRWLGKKTRTTVTGKPSGSVSLITGWVRWPPYVLALMISALIVSLYGTVVLGAITTVFGMDNSLTFDHLREVIVGAGQEAVTDTITLAVIATPIAGLLGMLLAWLAARHLKRSAGWLDFVGTLGIAVPGTVLGIGYVIAYRNGVHLGPVPVVPGLVGGSAVAGGALAIILAYVTRNIPAGLRTGAAALTQLHGSIEEASLNLGAGPLVTFRKVTLPLIRPAFLAGLSYSFARSMTSISTIILLVTPETKIMASQILSAASTGRYGVAFAYCTVLMTIILAGFGLIRILVGRAADYHRVADQTGRG